MPSKFKPGDRIRYNKAAHAKYRGLKRSVKVAVCAHPDANGTYFRYEDQPLYEDQRWHGWDWDQYLELVEPIKPKFTLDLTFDNVDQAIEIATMISAKIGKPVPILNGEKP